MIRLFICLALLSGLAACETVKGAGRDLQNAGSAMERAF
ncbi:entericidin A/B family lipoprotein [Pseudooceanicola sp. CBS1P-1]|uniref:Entericidin A/B family lipoprotein n=1 Tax=Pseudooceanicola albus TaxID=2692189 RepID=A0A6L7G7A8_9RHOB|nr:MULTISPECIES: entericidin A/B family lipoprotein [Pseudooceanicola]MBT9382942.1 entericidin A/B family lipoprotein [Pseudooceanicola endophyticus]MXN20134.1 entericidin A/B family lipoprotein [Pseudooceanicola albus]